MADEILNPIPTNGTEPAGESNAGAAQPNVSNQQQPSFDDMLKEGCG